MKNHKSIFALTAVFLTLAVFQSCQKSDTSNLQEAQFCLNKASAANARNCVTSIASNVTPYADSLRCSAIFISENFSTPAQFISAIDTLNGTGCGGTCSSTLNALTTFNFSGGASNAANTATANEAFTVCTKSGVKFYAQISSMFKLGTLAKIASGLSNPTASDIETAIGTLDAATLGDLVVATSAAVCTDTTNASEETKKYCAELALAKTGGATAASIGACLKAKLADPTLTVCPP